MKRILARLYAVYALLIFVSLFLIFLPAFFVLIFFYKNNRPALFLNLVWARLFFFFIGMPVEKDWRFKPEKGQNYIMCGNHFSYLDIAAIAYTPFPFVFVGKSSLGKIPLFGIMYKKLHVTVDRAKIRSGYNTFQKSAELIKEGYSLAIFPEGGIVSKNEPYMTRFKDGAFRTAIETGTPIMPVSMPYNWKILPDNDSVSMYWRRCKVVFHEPIVTSGMTLEDVSSLRQRVFDVIQNELLSQNKLS